MAAKPEYVKNNQRIGNAVKLAVVSLQVMSSNKSNKSNLILLANIINDPVLGFEAKIFKTAADISSGSSKAKKSLVRKYKDVPSMYHRHACSALVKHPL